MRRLCTALVFLLAIPVLVAAGGRATTDWKKLKYFAYEGHEMWLATDGTWRGAEVVSIPHLDAVAQGPFWARQRGLTRRFLWAATCNTGEQLVSFSRTFQAPGAAASGNFYMGLAPDQELPYRKSELRLNGVEVGEIVRKGTARPVVFAQGTIPAAALKAISFGQNTITLRVEKTAMARGERCNGKAPRRIGIEAELTPVFKADVGSHPSFKGAKSFVKSQGGKGGAVVGTIRLFNRGPSTSLAGTFKASVSAGAYLEVATSGDLVKASPPLRNCKVEQTPGLTLRSSEVTCTYKSFAAKRTATVTIKAAFKLTDRFPATATTELLFKWEINPEGGVDPTGNNGFDHIVTLCGPAAAAPGC